MMTIAADLTAEALRDRYVSSAEVMEARHIQTLLLPAKVTASARRLRSVGAGSNNSSFATMRKDLIRWAICVGATARPHECSPPRFSRSRGFACRNRQTTAVHGRAPRLLLLSRANWGWEKDGYYQGTRNLWAEVTRLADLPRVGPHTLGSTATSSGEALALTGAILWHANLRSTAIYAHAQLDPSLKGSHPA